MMIFILIYVKYLKRLGQCSFLYYLTNLIFLGRKWGGEKWPKTEHRDVSSYFHAKKFVYKKECRKYAKKQFVKLHFYELFVFLVSFANWNLRFYFIFKISFNLFIYSNSYRCQNQQNYYHYYQSKNHPLIKIFISNNLCNNYCNK